MMSQAEKNAEKHGQQHWKLYLGKLYIPRPCKSLFSRKGLRPLKNWHVTYYLAWWCNSQFKVIIISLYFSNYYYLYGLKESLPEYWLICCMGYVVKIFRGGVLLLDIPYTLYGPHVGWLHCVCDNMFRNNYYLEYCNI